MRNIRFDFIFLLVFCAGCSLHAQKIFGMDEYVVLDSVQPSKELLRLIDTKEFQDYLYQKNSGIIDFFEIVNV
jgi:hypothetical protein